MMINSYDINPLAHQMHLKELERVASQTGRRRIAKASRPPPLARLFAWFSRASATRVPVLRDAR